MSVQFSYVFLCSSFIQATNSDTLLVGLFEFRFLLDALSLQYFVDEFT